MDPVDAVFKNDLLMDNILKLVTRKEARHTFHHWTWGGSILNHLDLRTVNRLFNEAVIRKAQRQFSQFTIGYRRNDFYEEVDDMAVSNHTIPTAKTRQFFEFLSKAMKVKVRSIEVIDIFRSKGLRKRLHSEIWESLVGDNYGALTSVTGMEEICPQNCVDCLRVATQCRKYGPLQEHVLREAFNEKSHHFETLIVSDRLLNQIAARCSLRSNTKEECLAALEEIVHTRLSCSHLILVVEERAFNSKLKQSSVLPETLKVSREVIDRMLSVWGVRSVEIKLHSDIHFNPFRSALTIESYESRKPINFRVWTDKGFLTPVQFDGDFRDYKHSDLRFEHVTVNLEYAYFSMLPYIERVDCLAESSGYYNLISIVHRLFPTSRMRLELSRTLFRRNEFRFNDLGAVLELMKRVCWRDDPTNFHLDVLHPALTIESIDHQTEMNYSDFNVERGLPHVYESKFMIKGEFALFPNFVKTFNTVDIRKQRSISVEVLLYGWVFPIHHEEWPCSHPDKVSEIMWDFIYAYRKYKRELL